MNSLTFVESETKHIELPYDEAAWFPRDEAFDRITRTVARALGRATSLICIVDEATMRLRAADGPNADLATMAMPLCTGALLQGKALLVPDMKVDPRFWDNPLVTCAPYLRSYVGVPLKVSEGLGAGALCVMDARPGAFRAPDVAVLEDMARQVEAELRVHALCASQQRLLARLQRLEGRARVDAVTGCWNVRAFRDQIALSLREAQHNGTTLGLCYARLHKRGGEGAAPGTGAPSGMLRRLLGHALRARLPKQGAIASLGGADFCALVPGYNAMEVEERLAQFTFPHLKLDVPGVRFEMDVHMDFGLSLLHEMPTNCSATDLWASALANLDAGH